MGFFLSTENQPKKKQARWLLAKTVQEKRKKTKGKRTSILRLHPSLSSDSILPFLGELREDMTKNLHQFSCVMGFVKDHSCHLFCLITNALCT